jgi:hypothetical protein
VSPPGHDRRAPGPPLPGRCAWCNAPRCCHCGAWLRKSDPWCPCCSALVVVARVEETSHGICDPCARRLLEEYRP